ncbi:MAG: diguanylate cyclase [Anaerolineales bacterium]
MSAELEQIRKLNQQAWDLCKKDGPQALRLARKAQRLLSKCADFEPRDEFECLKAQTYCLDNLSQQEQALPIALRADQLAQQIGDKYLIGSIQSLLGRIYWHIDDYATSMDYYLNALKLVQTEGHPDLEISLINGLGLVQYGLENYSESLGYFKACLEKAGEEDLNGQADADNNIAYVLHMLGRDGEAVEYAAAALTLFNQIGNYVGKLHTLHSLGAIHLALRDHEQAMAYLQEGLELSRQNNSQLLELTFVSEISHIHQIEGNLDQAEEELLRTLQIAEKINSLTNISLIHERLTGIYKERQDYQSALEHFEAFHAAYKKIFNEKSDRRIKNLEILNQVESARKQAELYRELAGTDSLTNLVNRRQFLEIAEAAAQRVKSDKDQLSIIMLDIDHFKNVNDQYGHKAGDEVLSAVAASIKQSLRRGDIAGRYGGDEFVVLVSSASSGQCFKIAERIRQAVAQQKNSIGQAVVQVTVSLGLAWTNPDRMFPLDVLINYADQALYSAKRQGRDRMVAWTPDDQSMVMSEIG